MLTYKKYKELKKRRKFLNTKARFQKIGYKYSNRIKDYKMLNSINRGYTDVKKELNYINEILRMHKILWKQHLHNQEFFRNI